MYLKTVPLCVLALLVIILPTESFAANYEAFFGRYVGSTVGEEPKRDIKVTIKPSERGFNVTWSTKSTRTDGKIKDSRFSINFRSSRQQNVFGSAMGKNMFGHEKPLDPLKGDPYVWAIVDGKTMTVNSLLINENGGYEIQTYKRTLVDGGMSLEYSRVRNGEVLKKIRGQMKKVK